LLLLLLLFVQNPRYIHAGSAWANALYAGKTYSFKQYHDST